MRRGLLAGTATLASVVLIGWSLALAAILRCAGTSQRVEADAILVLGAAVWPGESASPILYSRVQTAIELYEQGYADALILSGGLGQYPPSEAEIMRRLAASAGVPDEALILEDRSHSTLDNVRNAAALMRQRGWKSVLVVSDPFHVYRVCRMAEDAGLEPYPVPASDSPGWAIPRLRVYYTLRETLAVMAYEVGHIWRSWL
jgi:uncharacterized SAM-binding protein YcdF (DUF218 family)